MHNITNMERAKWLLGVWELAWRVVLPLGCKTTTGMVLPVYASLATANIPYFGGYLQRTVNADDNLGFIYPRQALGFSC